MAIWCFDRLMRVVRVIFCNVRVRLGMKRFIHYTEATITYHQAARVLHIQIHPETPHLSPGPGQHYFLYQPCRLTGWENHPFTLASHDRESPSPDQPERLALSFWVRPQGGWTSQLQRTCSRAEDNLVSTTLLIEGPYGTAKPLWDYHEVLLIAGGSGIAAVMPYLQDYMNRCEASQALQTTLVHFIWTDRSEDNVRLTMGGPLGRVLQREDIETSIHITSGHSASVCALTSSEKTEEVGSPEAVLSKELSPEVRGAHLHLKSGRPDIRAVISTTAEGVSGRGRRLAVFVCGPASLADAARDATRRSMGGHNMDVRYFEETFGW